MTMEKKWIRSEKGVFGMIKYSYSDKEFAAKIYSDFSRCRNYTYEVFIELPEVGRKEITRSDPKRLMNLREAKAVCEGIIALLWEANDTGCTWIAKGVTLGFISKEEMEHLKPLTPPTRV